MLKGRRYGKGKVAKALGLPAVGVSVTREMIWMVRECGWSWPQFEPVDGCLIYR